MRIEEESVDGIRSSEANAEQKPRQKAESSSFVPLAVARVISHRGMDMGLSGEGSLAFHVR